MERLLRAFSVFILAAVLMTFGKPCAAPAAVDLQRVPPGERLPRFVDDRGFLTQEQAAELTARLDEISERHRFDTVVAVVYSLKSGSIKNRKAQVYAIDFFEQNGFGFGSDLDGAILLLATEDRDFGFAAYGFGLTAFTDAGKEYLEKIFSPHLNEDDYFKAFMAYADGADDFLTKAKAGRPYNKGNIPLTAEELSEFRIYSAVVSLVLALVIAFVVTLIWKRQLKTVRRENLANAYIKKGSMVLTERQDVLLFKNVTRTARPKDEGTGGGGGGTGTFRSSSGRTSTGRSGKY